MGIRSKRKIRTRTTDEPTTPSAAADWAALPHDILFVILSRVPQADILRGAGLACASWRRAAADEPRIWRRIDLAARGDEREPAPPGWKAMARAAVARSAGRCVSFRGRADADFLLHLAHSAPSLKRLHVRSRIYKGGSIARAVKKLPRLEQLLMTRGLLDGKSVLSALLDHCPRLRRLDAGRCYSSGEIGQVLAARCRRRIKNLRLPRLRRPKRGPCRRAGRYAG